MLGSRCPREVRVGSARRGREDAGSRQGKESLVVGLAGAGERAEGREQGRCIQCSITSSSEPRSSTNSTRFQCSAEAQENLQASAQRRLDESYCLTSHLGNDRQYSMT